MPISRRYACGDVEIAVWAIEETSEQLGEMLGSESLLQHARTFGSEARRAEWLAVRLLLREVAGADARIEYADSGKPRLAGASGYISISHTRGYAAVAFSRNESVGLDVELQSRNAAVACSYVMKENEMAAVPVEWRAAYLLLRWTACEAVYKLVGGANYKESLSMPVFRPKQCGVFTLSLNHDVPRLFSIGYLFDDGLLLTICATADTLPPITRL